MSYISLLPFAAGLALLLACGGTAIIDPGAGGAGAGGSGSTSTGGTTTTGSTSSSNTGGTGGVGDPCGGLPEAACLAAFPSCAPLYDDTCCPSCEPGPCADCIAYAFHSCVPRETVCGPGKASCGVVPDWACAGGTASCGFDWNGPCQANPGCVQAECSPANGCPCIPEQDCSCRAVTAKSCDAQCDAKPPPCPPGLVAESDGNCYTGWCIPASVCGG